jgi:hypothetical protein
MQTLQSIFARLLFDFLGCGGLSLSGLGHPYACVGQWRGKYPTWAPLWVWSPVRMCETVLFEGSILFLYIMYTLYRIYAVGVGV